MLEGLARSSVWSSNFFNKDLDIFGDVANG